MHAIKAKDDQQNDSKCVGLYSGGGPQSLHLMHKLIAPAVHARALCLPPNRSPWSIIIDRQVVLAFDLGGGTYDISLLEVGNGTIEVLSTGDAAPGQRAVFDHV